MTGDIVVQNEASFPIDESRLREAVGIVINQQGAPADASLTIVLTDDAEVRAFNRQYRGIDAPTDILSFPAEALPPGLDDESRYLGDLVVAYPYAMAQAEDEGHPLMDSLSLLVIHGTLHLFGYDHDTSANRAVMWAAQDRALTAMNISLDIVPALENYEQEQSGY
jgi:probable rRNA maturation factor